MTTRGTVPAGSARAADRRARRMSPQQRRDHLIATALQLYSRRHPEDVSIDDIVAAADVSRALFYRYFTNLREVHLAALGRVVDDLIAELALPAAGELRERLRTALSRFVAFAESYAGSYAALLRSGSTVADRNTDSLVERVRDHVVALFGGLLGAAQRDRVRHVPEVLAGFLAQQLAELAVDLLPVRGVDDAGRHRVDVDAVLGGGQRGGLGDRDDRGLGGAVGRHQRLAAATGDAGQVDDLAGALRAHRLQRGLGAEEQALHVDREDLVPLARGGVPDGLDQADAGVVDQHVEPAAGGHHPAQLHQLGGRRVHPRRVGQPGRHPERALGHRLGQHPPHPVELVAGGGPVGEPGAQHPQRALRHQVGRVDGDAGVQPVQVFADAAPVPVEPGRVVVPPGDLRAHGLQRGVVDRGVGQPVLPEHLQRHALRDLRQVLRLGQHLQVRVRVHVDEPGREHQPAQIGRIRVRDPARGLHGGDGAAGDQDVGRAQGASGAVGELRSGEQPGVGHGPLLAWGAGPSCRAAGVGAMPAAGMAAGRKGAGVRGEYKVPGGKLVAVDVEVADGRLEQVRLSGDFFLEPDEALEDINAALTGLPQQADAEQLAAAVRA